MKYVEQEKSVTTDHPKLKKIEFKVAVGQVESVEEAITDAGGADALVEFYNGQRATNAKNGARAYARNFEVDEKITLDEATIAKLIGEITTKGQEIAKDYSPATDTERGPSKAKKAQAFDKIQALATSGEPITREQLFELLALAK